MTQSTRLGDLALGVGLDFTDADAQLAKYKQHVERATGVKLDVDNRAALSATDRVKHDIEALGEVTKKQAAGQTQATRILGAQYDTARKAIQEQNAAIIAGSRQDQAAAQARTAQLREQQAQLALNTRLAAKQRQDERDATRQTLGGIETQVKAYRDLWQARVLSNDQVYAQQSRLREQALGLLLTVDKQSDAYRRLTAVAAGASRVMDQSQGLNTPGGMGAGVSQGITNALGQFGVTGDLIAGFIQMFTAKRAAAQAEASNLGRDTMAGLVAGMKNNQTQVKEVADRAGDSVAEAIRVSLDIHSPSRVTEYLGKMAGLGFVTGMKSYQGEAAAAARALSGAAEGGLRNTSVSGGAFGGATGNFDAGNLAASATALAALNQQLLAAQSAGEGAAEGSDVAAVAAEGLGESVGGAADQVKTLRDAHNNQDAASRQAALNEAQTAIAFTATAAAVTAVAVALVASYNTAADYQKGMSAAKATTEATADELARLDAVARSPQFVELGVGAKAAAAGIEELGSQGLSTADIVDGGLLVSLTLAKAVSTDVAKAAAVAASSTKAFGLEAKDLARIGDITTNAVNGTSIKMDNFSDSIAAGGDQAKRSGLNFTEFTAGISFLTDKAIGASDAGTSLKSFLMALTPNTKDAANEMKRLGFNAFDSQGNFKSLGEIAENLRISFAKLTPEQAAVSAEMIFGSDGARVYGALVEQGNKGVQERIALLDRQGTMEEAARQKMEGARGAQEKLNAAIENFKITAGSMLLGPAAKLLDWATGFMTKIDSLNQELAKVKGPGEIKATLKIDWSKDDATTIAYKLLVSGIEGTKNIARDLPGQFAQTGFAQNLQKLDALGLQTRLQELGVIETPKSGDIAAVVRQFEDIQANMGKYQVLLAEALARNTAANDRASASTSDLLRSQNGKDLITGRPLAGTQGNLLPGAGPLLPGQDRGGEVSGLAAVGFMGLAGRNRGTPYGQTYGPGGSWGRHNGEDWFAPTGTEIKAAFTGYVSTRWSNTTGHLLEMTDAKGQKILLGHLDRYATGVEQAIKAAGGRLLVQQGKLLAYVGQTGSLAHKDLGPGNAHVHVMGYDARGRVIDPMSQTYTPVAGQGWMGGVGAAGVAATKSFEEYRKEASRILAQIARFAPSGTGPDGAKWAAATGQLERFSKQNTVAANAVQYAQLQMGMAGKEVGKYGQAFDRLKGQLNLTDSLDKLGENVLPQLRAIQSEAQRAASTELARNGRTEKYRELLGLAADAASKLKSIEGRKPDLSPLQQEQQRRAEQIQQEDMLLKMRGKSAQQLADIIKGGVRQEGDLDRIAAARKEIDRREELSEKRRKEAQGKAAAVNEAIRQNDIASAKASLSELERLRDTGLQKVKGNAAAELAIQKQYADLVYNAKRAVLDKEKADRDADITNGSLPQGVKDVQLGLSLTTYENALAEIDADRAQRLETARTSNAEFERQAAKAARELRYADADATLARMKESNRQALADFKGSVVERLALIRQQSQAEFDAAELVARVKRDNALRDNDANTTQTQANREESARQIGQQYTDAVAALKNVRLGVLRTAQQDFNSAMQEVIDQGQSVRDAYSSGYIPGANGFENPGTGDTTALYKLADERQVLEEVQAAFAGLGDSAAESAGIIDRDLIPKLERLIEKTDDPQLKAAGQTYLAFLRTAKAELSDLATQQSEAWDGRVAEVQEVSDAYGELGDTSTQLSVLQGVLSDLFLAMDDGENVAAQINKVTAAIDRLLKKTEGDDVFNGFVAQLNGTVDEQIMQVMDRMASETDVKFKVRLQGLLATLRQQMPTFGDPYAAGYIPQPDGTGFTSQPTTGNGGVVLDAISLRDRLKGSEGEALTQAVLDAGKLLALAAGEALPEQLRTGLQEAVSDAQGYLAGLGEEAITDLLGRIGDAPEFAELRKQLEAAYTQAVETRQQVDATLGDIYNNPDAYGDGPSRPATTPNRFTAGEGFEAPEVTEQDVGYLTQMADVFERFRNGDLTDPDGLEAFTAALRLLKDQGKLTGTELQALLATIDDLTSGDSVGNSKPLSLSEWQGQLQILTDEFDSGVSTAEQYAEGLNQLGRDLEGVAQAADKAGNPALAKAFRDQAAQLRAMNPQIAGVLQKMGKVGEYADYVQQAAGAFGKLTGALGESEQEYDSLTGKKLETPWKDLTANLEGVANAAGKVMEIVTDVMKVIANPADIGAWVKLVTNVVRSIADAIAGFAKARAEVQRLKADFQEANPLLNGADYQNSYTRSRGVFADIFGGGPEVVNEIDKIGLPIAQSIAGAITSGISSGFDAYAQSGNIEDFAKAMNAELTKGIKSALVQGFLDDPQRKNDYAGLIKAFSDVWKTHDPAQIMAAAQAIYAQTQETAAAARDLAEQMDALDKLNGTGRYSPEAIAQRARDLASQALGVEEQALELQHTKGLLSTTEYEQQRLALALRRIEQERQQALAAAGLTAEQIALLNQQYDLQAEQAQVDADAVRLQRAKQLAKDLSGLTLNNAETALGIEEKLALSTAATEEEKYQIQRTYAERRLALTLKRLDAEEIADKAAVDMSLEGAQLLIDAISEKYRLARESAQGDLTIMGTQYAAQQRAALESQLNTLKGQWVGVGTSAFMAGLEKADFSSFLTTFKGNLTQALVQGVVEAEVGRLMADDLKPFIENYRLAVKTEGIADDLAAVAAIREGITSGAEKYRPIFDALTPLMTDVKNALTDNTAATKENTEASKQEKFYGTRVDEGTYPSFPPRSAALQGRLTR
jgi:TP901 family phage tail tape measure protein